MRLSAVDMINQSESQLHSVGLRDGLLLDVVRAWSLDGSHLLVVVGLLLRN